MDQIIEVFGIDWKILTVQVVNFSILMALLWYFLYTPIINLIEKRRAQIIKGVADAERAEEAVRDADAKKTEILATASLKAQDVIERARATAKTKEADMLHEAQEKYERVLVEANLKGEEIQREALTESKEEIAKLIVLGVEKTLKQNKA